MNNIELTRRIKHYIQLDTDYAVIINGDHGIGKTHYIKNSLFPEIEKIRIPNRDDQQTFMPVLVSLSGVKSIEDIQNQIFVGLHPIFKTKGVKIVKGLGKNFLKYIGIEPNADALLGAVGISNKPINSHTILLCFDDVHRKSKDLDVKEVFGFISNLVEHLGVKVLVVANEDEITKEIDDDGSYYAMIREKVIGISVTLSPDTAKIYDKIIDSKYKLTNTAYHQFLSNNKETILFRIEQSQQKLRNLVFFFDHFGNIFNQLHGFLNENKGLDEIKEDLKTDVLNFTLPIAIEYKVGNLNSSNYEEIKKKYQEVSFDVSKFLGEKKVIEEKTAYSAVYDEKYLKGSELSVVYFDSICQYILGNRFFDFLKLKKEINDIYHLVDNSIPEQEKLFQQLAYWKCVDIPYTDYKKLTAKLLSFVDSGAFPLDQYPSIFGYVVRFKNLMGYNTKKLARRFKRGIDKGKTNYKYVSDLQFRLSVKLINGQYDNEIIEVLKYCRAVNESIKKGKEQKVFESLFQVLKDSNMETFLEKFQDSQEDFRYKPVFAKFNAYQFWKIVVAQKNSSVISLAFAFKNRYSKNVSALLPEKAFLTKLKKELAVFMGRKSRTQLEIVTYTYLKDAVELALSNFTKEVKNTNNAKKVKKT